MTEPVRHDPQVDEADDAVVVTRSEERLVVTTRPGDHHRIRVSKRIVSEERVVTVTVRREELVVERLDGPEGRPVPLTRRGSGTHGAASATTRSEGLDMSVVELVLHEEEVEVATRAVPRERVKVFVDTVTELVDVHETLSREVVDVERVAPDAGAAPRSDG